MQTWYSKKYASIMKVLSLTTHIKWRPVKAKQLQNRSKESISTFILYVLFVRFYKHDIISWNICSLRRFAPHTQVRNNAVINKHISSCNIHPTKTVGILVFKIRIATSLSLSIKQDHIARSHIEIIHEF